MDLRQLEALVAVADHGRFSAAARALHTVQSNVSTRISRLEKELNTTLVDRSTGALTPEGTVVVARARRISAELDSLAADVASMTSHVTGNVGLGVIGTTGRWIAPAFLDAMARELPGIDLTMIESTTTALLPLLVTGQIDLAVVNVPLDHPEVATSHLFDEQLVVIAPTDHPLGADGDREVGIEELARHPVLLGPARSLLRDLIESAAHEAGVSMTALAELDGVRLSATLAFQGYGPAIVPATAIPTWAERGDWVVLDPVDIAARGVGLAVRRRGLLSTAAAHTRDLLQRTVSDHGPAQLGITVDA